MHIIQKVLRLFLIIVCVALISSSIADAADRPVFEKGDAIYSDCGENHFLAILGHCGLYWYWEDISGEKPNDPDKLETHKIIEASRKVRPSDFAAFYDYGEFWGVCTNSDLTWKQRSAMMHCAERQIGCKYSLAKGYKSPRVSFRCDGLVEYCYERVGVDLVPNDKWWTLSPLKQMLSNKLALRTSAEVKEVRLEPSGAGTLKAYASDGDKGSGITMVEFWDGKPDDTPDNYPGKRLGWDDDDADVGDEYTYDYDGAVAQLYAKAFDQAGNTKIAGILEYTYVDSWACDSNHSSNMRVNHFVYWHPDESPMVWFATYIKATAGYDYLHLWCYYAGAYGGYSDLVSYSLKLYAVDPMAYMTTTITWNTQPPDGRLLWEKTFTDVELKALAETWITLPICGEGAVVLRMEQGPGPIDPNVRGRVAYTYYSSPIVNNNSSDPE